MRITADEVRETALLARLELSPEEAAHLQRELDAILGYMDKLAALDVSGVEPTTHAVPLDCPLEKDAPGPQLPVADALAAAPRTEGELFVVPKVIEVSG
jgi:aspartyl-tRNA(Asn)/glutamyl-tRNA(Gln) amidotransferase subunit C